MLSWTAAKESRTQVRSHRGQSAPARNIRRGSLRFVTFLAPGLCDFYEFLAGYLGQRLGVRAKLLVGDSYAQLAGEADAAFVCGLAYVEHAAGGRPAMQPLAAPVLRGERYHNAPVYFSDIVVRRDSPCRSFADLRGRAWAYNEPLSHSGYGVVRYYLARLGEVNGYFSRVVQSGWHDRSLLMLCRGEVDGTAVDSHVLEVWRRAHPELAGKVRVMETLGPSTIQPLVVRRHLPRRIKAAMRAALLAASRDEEAALHFRRALVRRFVAVTDGHYNDIRHMRDAGREVKLASKRP